MTLIPTFGVATMALLLLASSAGQATAQAVPGRPPPPPPPPRIVFKPPTVSTLQQPSFWGVNTNLQRKRDRLQRTRGDRSGGPSVFDNSSRSQVH